jgi:hypothetical protein
MGQQYIGAAILHHLEGFHVQSFDLGVLFSDSTRTPEAELVQLMIEARRHTPSVVFIPNIETWFYTISDAARSTFRGILRNINPTESILVLGLADSDYESLDPQVKELFGYSSENHEELTATTTQEALKSFFQILRKYVTSKPTDYPDPDKRRKRVLEQLPIAPTLPAKPLTKVELKQQEKKDMQLKNLLKLKLSGIMDLFKNRYKRFKKPPVEDILLVHLFEPPEDPSIQHAFVKSDDDMILEVATGKKYYNIDLDVIEERLWNGYYSEPKQYLKDIEMIHLDAITTGDRERTVKASEMYANAQVTIEEIGAQDPQFLQACKDMHSRGIAKRKAAQEAAATMHEVVSVTQVANGVVDVVVPDAPQTIRAEANIELSLAPGEVDEMDVDPIAFVAPEASKEVSHAMAVEEPVEQTVNGSMPNNGSADALKQESQASELQQEQLVQRANDARDQLVEQKPVQGQDQPVVGQEGSNEDTDFILSEELVDEFEARLVKLCSQLGLVLEQLEQVNTSLVDVIWKHRNSWDRNSIVAEMNITLDSVLKSIVEAQANA